MGFATEVSSADRYDTKEAEKGTSVYRAGRSAVDSFNLQIPLSPEVLRTTEGRSTIEVFGVFPLASETVTVAVVLFDASKAFIAHKGRIVLTADALLVNTAGEFISLSEPVDLAGASFYEVRVVVAPSGVDVDLFAWET